MSFDMFLIGIILVESMFVIIATYFSFKQGYLMGVKDYNMNHADSKKAMPTRKAKVADVKANKELEKLATILENIENYDGTEAHQKEIK